MIAVVKVTVLLSDIADWPKVNTVYEKCMYLVAFWLHHQHLSNVWYRIRQFLSCTTLYRGMVYILLYLVICKTNSDVLQNTSYHGRLIGNCESKKQYTILCPKLCQMLIYFPDYFTVRLSLGLLGSRVVNMLDSGAEGPGFKSQLRYCLVTVLGKLFTPIVPLFTKQQNW